MLRCIATFTRVGMVITAALFAAAWLPFPFSLGLSWLILLLFDPVGDLEKWYKESQINKEQSNKYYRKEGESYTE